jgi:hypothetical protein
MASDSDDDKSASSNKEEANEEDEEMKKLMGDLLGDAGDGSDDSSSSGSESGEEAREIDLEDNVLDHVVLAAADFEAALEEFTDKTGVAPKIAGAIKGLGIKTARVSFEGSSYLEIIAPDPKSGGPIGNLLKASGLTGLKPFHWAIRNARAEPLKDEVNKFGYTPDHISMFGAKEDGTPRKWEMLYLYGHRMGGITPFYINWANSDHPCETMPIVGDLISVSVSAPTEDPIHKLIAHTESSGFSLAEGDPSFEIKFDSPEGEIAFSATKMVGFRFPGFEDECGPIEGEEPEEMPEFVMPEMPELLQVPDADYDEIPATEEP